VSVLETLVAARAFVARGWCQRVDARDAYGRSVRAASPSAVCMCAEAAIEVAAERGVDPSDAFGAVKRAAGITGAIFDWQDTPGRTQAEVLAAFDKAIAAQGGAK
jgi:hypothetical protein